MRWWLTSLVTATVGAGLAIVVNVATDLKHDLWAWVAVAVLTVASATATAWSSKRSTAAEAGGGSTVAERPDVAHPTHNETSGTVSGSVIQVGTVTVADSTRPRNQTAVGFGNSVIQQAGGDIYNTDRSRPNG
jgi:hypothetical protein